MATQLVCDLCKQAKASVKKLESHVIIHGAVTPETVTGTSTSIDACDECQNVAQDYLHTEAKAQLKEELPEHKLIFEENATVAKLPKAEQEAARETYDAARAVRHEALLKSRETRMDAGLAKARKLIPRG